ncbi:MAG: class I SAM-dependent methyltransferase [Deltaproteobacteria bacterium]|nr:class I SAM-dependent methyltransferase [Deltaproteobacteria bacterium]
MKSFNKVGMTAKFVAYWRQYSDIPFAKDIAEFIDANKTIETFLSKNQITTDEISWYAPLFEVRYKSILKTVRRKRMKQVLELASGISLRGLNLTQDTDISYVETDLEELTDEKIALVSMLRQKYSLADNGNFRLSAANALDLHQLVSAIKHFRNDLPVAVISEGLFPYLTIHEMETVVRNVRHILMKFGGIWITPDFLLKGDSAWTFPHRRRVGKAIAELTGRQLHRTMFDNEQQLFTVFDGFGLRAEVLNQADLVPAVVSLDTLKLPAGILEKARQKLNLWILTPAAK